MLSNFNMLAQTQIGKAHIAEADPARYEEARSDCHMAREIVAHHLRWDMVRRNPLPAAARAGFRSVSEVVRLATEAQEMFVKLDLTADAAIAERRIHSPDVVA